MAAQLLRVIPDGLKDGLKTGLKNGSQNALRRAPGAWGVVTDAFAEAPRFMRLKLALLAGAFRRSPWQLVGLIIAALYGIGITVLLVLGLVVARAVPQVETVRSIVIVAGAVTTLGFLLLPLVFGVDDTLDPRKFALFGIPTTRLAVGLATGSLLSVPSAALAVCALATVITWSHGFWLVLLALFSAAIATCTCVLAARVATAVAAFLLDTRRARELTGVIGVLLVVLLSPVAVSLANVDWQQDGLSVVTVFADILRFSPVGAAWAVPADTAAGHGGAAALELLIALVVLAALWLAWRVLVGHMLVNPGRSAEVKVYSGLGWFSAMPGRAWGAVAARSMSYWTRDPRYWVTLIMVPIIPVLILGALAVVHAVPGTYLALLPLPIMLIFLGWAPHNDVAYDGTAIWLHVVSGTAGLADRIGRLVPVLCIGIPLIAVGTAVSVGLYGDVAVLPAMLGVCLCELLVGLGLSSVTSALVPYPVAKPGDSPFQQPQSVGAVAGVVQGFSLVVILVLSAPSIVFAVLGVFVDPAWFLPSFLSGVLIGGAAAVGGVWGGAAIFNRRGPEVLESALRAA